MPESFDSIAADLQELRGRAGHPSYAVIAHRIAQRREAEGVDPAASRPARTTVYDAFRSGRKWIDPVLVRQITLALGASPDEASAWEDRCRQARSAVAAPAAAPVEPPPAPAPASAAPLAAVTGWAHLPRRRCFVCLVLIGCLALNLLGGAVVQALDLALFLDMVGTAIAAIVLGPWWGALVGLGTNLLAAPFAGGWDAAPFAVVNVAGALVWGYGIRTVRFHGSLPGYFALNGLVAVTCTMIAVPITLGALDGRAGHRSDGVAETISAYGSHFAVAVFSANLLLSVVDKVISGFIALTVVELLPGPSLLRRMTRPGAPPESASAAGPVRDRPA